MEALDCVAGSVSSALHAKGVSGVFSGRVVMFFQEIKWKYLKSPFYSLKSQNRKKLGKTGKNRKIRKFLKKSKNFQNFEIFGKIEKFSKKKISAKKFFGRPSEPEPKIFSNF